MSHIMLHSSFLLLSWVSARTFVHPLSECSNLVPVSLGTSLEKKKSTICPDWSALTGLSGQDSLCFHISSATGVLGTLLRVGTV